MPYIKQARREALMGSMSRSIKTAGELNFLFTELINEYLGLQELDYQNINDVVGALEGAKLEFYRRVVTPYENQKLAENGDVYRKDFTGES